MRKISVHCNTCGTYPGGMHSKWCADIRLGERRIDLAHRMKLMAKQGYTIVKLDPFAMPIIEVKRSWWGWWVNDGWCPTPTIAAHAILKRREEAYERYNRRSQRT